MLAVECLQWLYNIATNTSVAISGLVMGRMLYSLSVRWVPGDGEEERGMACRVVLYSPPFCPISGCAGLNMSY